MCYHFEINSVNIGKRNIYRDNTIVLPAHGITCISGNNGSGKTTLLNHIFYNNPETIALIAQENDLIFSELNVSENIMLFNKNEELLNSLLQQLNMNSLLNRESRFLSGGEKRLIAVLRMFFVENDIIFLDEPTNDLDYMTVDLICKMIKKLSEKKSILIVTHDSRILSLSNNEYHFKNGEIYSNGDKIECEQKKIEKKEVRSSINRFFKFDITGLFLFFLILISIIITGLFLLNKKKSNFIKLDEQQSNIASMFYASPDSLLNNGYIPLKSYLEYSGEMNIEYLKNYQKNLKESLSSGGTLNMFLNEKMGEKVIPVIIIDVSTNQKYNVMDMYISEKKEELGIRVIPEDISLFDGISDFSEVDGSEIKEPIDLKKYVEVVDVIMGEDSAKQPVLYSIVEMNEDQIRNLEGNYYIKNGLTVQIQKDVILIQCVLNGAKLLAVLLCSSIFLYSVYNNIMMKNYRKHISIFRNMGISYEALMNSLIQKRGMLKIKIISSLFCAAACLILGINDPARKIIYYSLSCICVFVGIPVVLITYGIIKRYVEKIYTFGGIYDN